MLPRIFSPHPMKILKTINDFDSPLSSIGLTIGNFDGVHLGHQAILKRLKEVASCTVLFTFSNHPSEALRKESTSYLTTLAHRLALFETMGIEYVILTPFTTEFAKQSAKEFLITLKKSIPFSSLILGHDARIGHDRNPHLQQLAQELNFNLEYLEPIQREGKVISSSDIRRLVQKGELVEASKLLGRPYSLYASVEMGFGKGAPLGFPTANLPVKGLALPPLGVYAVKVIIEGKTFPAVANLGYAPTLHEGRPPCLEVHLIDTQQQLYGKQLEVIFLKYLRSEKKFDNLTALKEQIHNDILLTKTLNIPS